MLATAAAGSAGPVRAISGRATENGPAGSSTSSAEVADGAAYRERLIQEILSRDKEIFELKRQHELSMLRVEQNQRRVLKDQEDRGMYYEQNCNVHTFDTVSVGLYTQRNTLYHTMSVERLRNVKLLLTLLVTLLTCFYLYYRYMINPDWVYVEKPLKLIGSRVGALNDIRAHWSEQGEERMTTQSKLRE
ncbi:uncharacterized protein Tco025E_02366 [Trypanosoma conorhini]|uniref:Uncharacterized protein n=1 Tax=Trypanosoma conorhini TaxID=83891 RepID=A0A3R7M179_9TRYP|nr:uncharacterized protein Tco025E_02366 [Trypanosoma conorhini]RNF24686.1 hypothetical protein Tco025E_02366 [Trypanosoma conorhini]